MTKLIRIFVFACFSSALLSIKRHLHGIRAAPCAALCRMRTVRIAAAGVSARVPPLCRSNGMRARQQAAGRRARDRSDTYPSADRGRMHRLCRRLRAHRKFNLPFWSDLVLIRTLVARPPASDKGRSGRLRKNRRRMSQVRQKRSVEVWKGDAGRRSSGIWAYRRSSRRRGPRRLRPARSASWTVSRYRNCGSESGGAGCSIHVSWRVYPLCVRAGNEESRREALGWGAGLGVGSALLSRVDRAECGFAAGPPGGRPRRAAPIGR